jgi:hypothetical protein
MLLDKGKYLTVWKKQADGSWKVLFDMFNSDLPPSLLAPACPQHEKPYILMCRLPFGLFS